MSKEELEAAERFFHEKIPLTRAMGVRVVPDQTHGFAIEAPVELNHNHLHTAFGGSINSVATLAGYGLLWLQLRGKAQLVIAESSIRFLRPVRQTIHAVCLRPPAAEFDAFTVTWREKNKSGITLTVNVEENSERVAEFRGTFFALGKS